MPFREFTSWMPFLSHNQKIEVVMVQQILFLFWSCNQRC